MDGESLGDLRYKERERKTIENVRRQALLEIQYNTIQYKFISISAKKRMPLAIYNTKQFDTSS